MNITDDAVPAASAPAVPVEASPVDTDLISRLARELYSGVRLSDVPAIPTGVPSLSGIPSGATGDNDLAGGYPHASAPTHPPVHSVIPTAHTEASPALSQRAPASGAHDPGNRDTHAFGEPNCEGFGSHAGAAPQSTPCRDAGRNRTVPTQNPLEEAASAPGFYFLPASAAPESPAGRSNPPAGSPGLSTLEVESIRRDFPALHQRVNGHPLIWLDNAATTHKPQAVIDATSRFYSRDNSNIHRAAHALAARSTDLFEGGREKVRRFLGAADAKEIVFTRGTTESINLVAQSWGRKNIGAGDEILVTRMEHHANIVPWQLLAQQTGAVLKVAPIDDRGELILEEFVRLLGPRTRLVSVTHVSNALGTINPVEQIIALSHARGVPVLVDGAQSTPHLPIDVRALDVDFLVFSGHKVFGPTGIGALYGKSSHLAEMPPWQGGGHMIRDVTFEKTVYQDPPERFEAGTPDIAGVVGLGAAVDYLQQIGLPAIAAYEHALLEYATDALREIPGLRFIGTAPHKASVLSFVIPGIANQDIARHLDQRGIAVRAGHHCAQPAQRHFGVEGSVRPSLAFYNTHGEVDTLVSALRELPKSANR